MKPDLSSLSTAEAGLLQAQAYRALRKFLTDYLKQFDISMSEWAVLGRLYCAGKNGAGITEIAESLAVKLPLATNLVNSLKVKDLVLRHTDPADRRARTVKLSRQGERFFDQTEAKLRVDMRIFLADITPAELATYMVVLTKIAAKSKTQPTYRQ